METAEKPFTESDEASVAIIGMAGRFPGAGNIEAFWQNLKNGVESVSFFSEEELIASGINPAILSRPNYVRAKGVLSDVEWFDAAFFGFNPREAELTDIQHRIFLECAWESLENAGYVPERYESAIGVYAGTSMNTYFLNNVYPNQGTLVGGSSDVYQLILSNDRGFLTTMVSYKLNLRGPSLNVQTACSTSLVAVHLACQSLLNGECDIALAGGVSADSPQKAGYLYEEGMILSPDGCCRAFDAKAKGIVPGNGCGIVVLKRLIEAVEDGDHIYAVIRGSAVNNDGSLKVGYTAPSVNGQRDVITEAQAVAGIDPGSVTYVETHGTGTVLGDPIEIEALTQAFRNGTEKQKFCAIGSVKTNIGHLDAAAGITGLIKTALMMTHQMIPKSLNFETPNPKLSFEDGPFYVSTELSEWEADETPRRAGVSSFGIGGTNAHMILEETPQWYSDKSGVSRPWQLLLLSAKTETALDQMTLNLADHLTRHTNAELRDVAYTLHVGRSGFDYRRMLVCRDSEGAAAALHEQNPQEIFTSYREKEGLPVIFLFSGQGSQYVDMGLELYQTEPVFQDQVDQCSELLRPHLGLDLRDVLYQREGKAAGQTPLESDINQTAIAQPAIFVIEYALAKLWESWGVRPAAMIGHSIGEYVAACLAGVFSLEDALSLVAARGKLVQQCPPGAMLAVSLPEAEVASLLAGGDFSLAAVNTPSLCVVSGEIPAIQKLQDELAGRGVKCQQLHTSHAFHSEMIAPAVAAFTERVRQISLNPPQIPYISNVTGTWITASEATDPMYWAKHLRQTVRFADGIQEFLKTPDQILLEVGPGRTLSTLARQQADPKTGQVMLTSLRHPKERYSDTAFILKSLGRLWLAGASVDWDGFHVHENCFRVPLPTYPFERQRYWIEPQNLSIRKQEIETPDLKSDMQASETRYKKQPALFREENALRPNLPTPYAEARSETEQKVLEIFQELTGIAWVGIYDNFFELGGNSLLATQGVSRLREFFEQEFILNDLFDNPTPAGLAAYIESVCPALQKQTSQDSSVSGNRIEGEL